MKPPRGYTVAQICRMLPMARSTFFQLKAAGKLPFLELIDPPAGRCLRFRADLVDRYVENRWNQLRAFSSHRRAS